MSTPDPQPRAIEIPLPVVRSDPPALDSEMGYTTSDDDSGWATTPARTTSVTRTQFVSVFLYAGYGMLRYVVCKTGIHKRKPPR